MKAKDSVYFSNFKNKRRIKNRIAKKKRRREYNADRALIMAAQDFIFNKVVSQYTLGLAEHLKKEIEKKYRVAQMDIDIVERGITVSAYEVSERLLKGRM